MQRRASAFETLLIHDLAIKGVATPEDRFTALGVSMSDHLTTLETQEWAGATSRPES
jgi:hypothetical protein